MDEASAIRPWWDFRDDIRGEQSCWALGLWIGLAILDVALWSRSWAGAMTVPLPAPFAIGSCAIVMAVAVTALNLWRAINSGLRHAHSWWPAIATLALPMAWGLAVGGKTTPFTAGGLLACCGLLIVSVGLAYRWVDPPVCERATAKSGAPVVEISDHGSRPMDNSPNWQRRLTLPEGDVIEGEIQVVFAAGQKEATFHLAFCPPLTVAPEIHAEDALGGELDIRTEASHPFGARLAIRRPEGWEVSEARQISYSAVPARRSENAA